MTVQDRDLRGVLVIQPASNPCPALPREPCGVCGRRVVVSYYGFFKDKRRGPEGLLRCQDHLGVEIDPATVPPGMNVLDIPCPECGHGYRYHDHPEGCRDCDRENEDEDPEDVEDPCMQRHPAMPKRWWMWTCPVCNVGATRRMCHHPVGCSFCDRSHLKTRGRIHFGVHGPVVIAYSPSRRPGGRHNRTVPLPRWWP